MYPGISAHFINASIMCSYPKNYAELKKLHSCFLQYLLILCELLGYNSLKC